MIATDDNIINSFMQQAQRDVAVIPVSTPPPDPNPVLTDQKVSDIAREAVSSPAGKNALQRAIDDLGDPLFPIELFYTNVARGLTSALARVSTPDLERDIRQFQAEWDQYSRVMAYASCS